MKKTPKFFRGAGFSAALTGLLLAGCSLVQPGIKAAPDGKNVTNEGRRFRVKWDISKKDNQLVQGFTVNAKGKYRVVLDCRAIDKKTFNYEDRNKLIDFLSLSPTGHQTGVVIPVTMKIDRIDGKKVTPLVPEENINTYGLDSGGLYHMSRYIHDYINFPAGKYRITISADHAVKLPPDVETFLEVSNDEKPKPFYVKVFGPNGWPQYLQH